MYTESAIGSRRQTPRYRTHITIKIGNSGSCPRLWSIVVYLSHGFAEYCSANSPSLTEFRLTWNNSKNCSPGVFYNRLESTRVDYTSPRMLSKYSGVDTDYAKYAGDKYLPCAQLEQTGGTAESLFTRSDLRPTPRNTSPAQNYFPFGFTSDIEPSEFGTHL